MSGVVRHPGTEAGATAATRARLRAVAERRFMASLEGPTRFFDGHADVVSRACLAMARRFRARGRLLVFGEGAAATDAQHVAVEFVHPVLVGKRALPALSLASDAATLSGISSTHGRGSALARTVTVLGRAQDIAMGIAGPGGGGDGVGIALARARDMSMLTIALLAGDENTAMNADFVFRVPSSDPLLVQEVHETLYHVLWELVHVFLEHGAGA